MIDRQNSRSRTITVFQYCSLLFSFFLLSSSFRLTALDLSGNYRLYQTLQKRIGAVSRPSESNIVKDTLVRNDRPNRDVVTNLRTVETKPWSCSSNIACIATLDHGILYPPQRYLRTEALDVAYQQY